MPAPTVRNQSTALVVTANSGPQHDLESWTVTAGSTLVCALQMGTANRVPDMEDTVNGAWQAAELEVNDGGVRLGIFYLEGAAAGSTTIRVNVSQSSNSRVYAWVWELSDCTLDISDTFVQTPESASHPHAPAGSIDTAANVWLCGVQRTNASTGSLTPAPNWTEKASDDVRAWIERSSDSALTDERAINTRLSTNRRSHSCIASFEAAGGPTPIDPAELRSSSTIAELGITQAHVLAAEELASSSTASAVGIAQAHIVALEELASSSASGAVGLVAAGELSLEELRSASTAAAAGLVQAHVVALEELRSSSTSGTPTLITGLALDLAELLSSSTASTVVIDQAVILALAELRSSSTAEAVALVQAGTLELAELLSASTGATVVLIDDQAIPAIDAEALVVVEADATTVIVLAEPTPTIQ